MSEGKKDEGKSMDEILKEAGIGRDGIALDINDIPKPSLEMVIMKIITDCLGTLDDMKDMITAYIMVCRLKGISFEEGGALANEASDVLKKLAKFFKKEAMDIMGE